MKAIEDLIALIPSITEELKGQDHEIGNSYFENDEDGLGLYEDKIPNYYCHEKDGWLIEVYYDCCGEWDCDPGDYWTPPSRNLRKAWGEVTEITAYHYDEDTEDETLFSEDDIKILWNALDKELKNIA